MGKATVDGVQLRFFTGLFSVTTPAKFRPLSWSSVGATKEVDSGRVENRREQFHQGQQR